MDDLQLPAEIDSRLEEEQDKNLARKVAFGQDAENFLRSPLGRHLCLRAERERVDHLEALARVALTTERGREDAIGHQFHIAVLDKWQEWIADVIQEGVTAEKEFIERRG
jgi:hypothetical protein